ncbi:EamA family transporter [Yinghuangia seranimata]|uniref:EamA family transporter n=1 Tax=Yinghuangia seranimata TaxID=408067 RepID=UPI00248C0A52|nr:EamA family transporter [Yinghuangia seranimata]MDI2132238.1 EamA family transporter [Yinghuangia seranimata]
MQRIHTAQAALVALLWGLNFVVIDYGLDSFPPLLFVALRFFLVAVPAVFFVPRPKVSWWLIAGVGLFLCVGQFGFLFSAMHAGMPAGLSSLVLQCQAVFTMLFAVALLGERPARARVLALGLAAVGLAVIAVGRGQGAGLGPFLLLIAAGASWGMGNVLTRKAGPAASGLGLVVWSGLVVPVPMAVLSLLIEGPGAGRDALTHVHASGVFALLYIVVAATFVGYGLWFSLMSRYPASTVAPFSLLVPPIGVLAAAVVLGERPTAWDVVGGVVVLAGIALASRVGAPKTGTVVVREGQPAAEPAHADGRAPEGSPAAA